MKKNKTKEMGIAEMKNFLSYDEKIEEKTNTFEKIMAIYEMAIEELKTKTKNIQKEYQVFYEYELIDHINTRIKKPDSIINKMKKKGYELTYKEMIEKINAGDASVDPYMEFANTYPVRDSMRMMRLLYRLGIGSQERKQDRLMMFSRSVSSLQNKAREVKYKERLGKMEGQTMTMLVTTGIGVMIILLIAMMSMFGA